MSGQRKGGVALPEGHSGSTWFRKILADTVDAFPEAFAGVRIPGGKEFKKRFPDVVARFEAARVASPQRADIARSMADHSLADMVFERGDGRLPFTEYLAQTVPSTTPGAQTTRVLTGAPGWVPEVPFRGRTYRGAEITELIDLLDGEHQLSRNASQGLRWIVDHATRNGGIDLTGHRFAMLGAGAEMAPTDLLLRAGATILWIDLAAPEALEARAPLADLAGEIVTADGAGDLLVGPAQVTATLLRFAEGGPMHLGCFAYAPGRGRELRLAAAMEGIARYLPTEAIRSIGMYISPTAPAAVQPGELESARIRSEAQPAWQKALCRVGGLSAPGHIERVACTTVPLQGPTYLAAQYVSKVMMAERWATLDGAPIAVSANVAGITNTKSLEHKLFQIAFAGAPTMGVQIFDTETTRPLSALLWLRDLLDPDAPGAASRTYGSPNERADAALSQQIHGGVFSLPWEFWSAIRVATVVGTTKKPRLLFS